MTPLLLPRPPAHLGLIGPPQCGASFVAQAIIAANPGQKIIVKDFSTRPIALQSNDPWLIGASKLAEAGRAIVISVLHSGGSGRDVPDPSLFFELWALRVGWPATPPKAQDLNGTELILDRGGNRPLIKLRSDDGYRTYSVIADKETVS